MYIFRPSKLIHTSYFNSGLDMVSWMNVTYRDQSDPRRNMISILADFPACTA